MVELETVLVVSFLVEVVHVELGYRGNYLADEGGEVVVFEVQGEEVLGEVLGVMHLA